jgi:7,8-dihydropterin-6-yl-methyl-4-(beta-D-ribofuranosyl)aminobenzene 5'-phosphate synthase
MKAKSWVAYFMGALPMLLAGCAATSPSSPAASADPTAVQITVLYDAFGKSSGMQKDWGYAALVEYRGKRILFDTGNHPGILAQNAKAKGIELAKLDFVVMSHRHGDHMGGMAYLLSVNPKVKIYAPKEGFGVYGGDLPSTFYRKDASLPPEQRYYDGAPPAVMRFGAAWPDASFELIDKTTEIAPGIHLIALVSDKPGTLELRELSLAINTPNGIVIIVGCSHPGIDKIVAAAAAVNPRIHFIAGGFHLVVSNDKEIETIVATLRDTFKVNFVAPGHCTGEPTFTALKKAFGERYLYAGLGLSFTVGAAPRATAESVRHGSTTMDEDDLASYRTAMPITLRLRLSAEGAAAADDSIPPIPHARPVGRSFQEMLHEDWAL